MMSIKRIITFVALALLVYAGGYVAIYGLRGYVNFSGPERSLNNMQPQELQDNMRVKGTLDEGFKVITKLGEQDVTAEILGFPIGGQRQRVFYLLLLNPGEEDDKRQYCAVAAEDDDAARLEELQNGGTEPFEFTGFSIDISYDIREELTDHLRKIYTPDLVYYVPNVEKYIIPYTIFIMDNNNDYIIPIVAGGAAALAGVVAIVLLARNTYKKTHMY